MKIYFIYIVTNKSKSTLYIGITNNLERRLIEHKNNAGNKKTFAGRYNCHFLVYYEEYTDINFAISREKEIKKWRREKKNKLIEMMNPNWDFLNT